MGWLTPLVPHISGGRRGARWRIAPAPHMHGEAMGFEIGDRAALQMEMEWFRTEEALAVVLDHRQVLIERAAEKHNRQAERERQRLEDEADQRRRDQMEMLDPKTYWWVATPKGRYRHAVRSFLTRQKQAKQMLCGPIWSVHACSVEELMLLEPCPNCQEAIEVEQRIKWLREAT